MWALAAMRAAELQFPNPSASPSWLDLAISVFNDQAGRWDSSTCDGGLRWQIYTFNQGYDYKNAISTGAFFQLAARLARYTGNQTYADWASKSYDWTSSVGLISHDYKVYDGVTVNSNCGSIDHIQWTYAAGAFMYGSAVMTNFVRSSFFASCQIILTAPRQIQTRRGRPVRMTCSHPCRSSLQEPTTPTTLPPVPES